MSQHVRDDELMDVAEGTAPAAVRRHVEACGACRERVAEAAAGWDLAAGADVPEPAPVYWDAFRKQVGRRVGSERGSRPVAWLPALAAAAVIAIGVGWLKPALAPTRPVSTLPAWSAALPAPGEEAGLAQLGLDTATAEEWAMAGCSGLADCLSGLSDEETVALTELLSRELEQGSDL
jgi:hypothetical protein